MKARASGLLLAWALCGMGLGSVCAAAARPDCAGPPGAVMDAAIQKEVALPLKQGIDSRGASASLLVFVRDGKVRVSQAAGLEDPDSGVPVTTSQSRFALASVSKTFIAVSLAQLKVAGRIHGYDDAVNDYLRSYRLPAFGRQQVTLRELATHTSGMDKVESGMMVLHLLPEQAAAGEYRAVRPMFFRPPGDIKAYSDFGIDVLGLMVSDLSGMPYGRYLRTHVLDPLGMSHTSVASPDDGGEIPHEVKPFDPVQMRILKPPKYPAPIDYPADGVFTTGDDMARYLMALLGGPGGAGPVSPAVRGELFHVLYQDAPQGAAHALVFEILRARGHMLAYHMGVGSSMCMLAVVPDENAGLFYCMANAAGALDPQQFAKAAFDVMTRGCGSAAVPVEGAVKTAAWQPDWGSYLGDFVSTDRRYFGPARLRDVLHAGVVPILRVARGSDGLSVNGSDGLRELSPGVFGVPGGFETYSFYRDARTGHMLLNSSTEATAVFERVWPAENPAVERALLPVLVLITASGLLWPLWPRARRQGWAAAGAVLLGLSTFGQVASLAAHPWDGYMLGILWPLLLMRLFGFASVPAAALLSAGVATAWRSAPDAWRRPAGLGRLAWVHLVVLTVAAWLTVWALMHLGMIGFLMR